MKEQSFILPHGKKALLALLDTLPMARKWRVTVKLYRRQRSNEQNNALWGVAYPAIRMATGNEADDLHTYFCGEYWGWVEVGVLDQVKRKPRRTTTRDESGSRNVISTVDFADFYLFIQQRCASVGVNVPDPNEHLEAA